MSYIHLPSQAAGTDDDTSDIGYGNSFNNQNNNNYQHQQQRITQKQKQQYDLDDDLNLDTDEDLDATINGYDQHGPNRSFADHNNQQLNPNNNSSGSSKLQQQQKRVSFADGRTPAYDDDDEEEEDYYEDETQRPGYYDPNIGPYGAIRLKNGQMWEYSQPPDFLAREMERKRRGLINYVEKSPWELVSEFCTDPGHPVRFNTIETRLFQPTTIIILIVSLLVGYFAIVTMFPFGMRTFENEYPQYNRVNHAVLQDTGLYQNSHQLLTGQPPNGLKGEIPLNNIIQTHDLFFLDKNLMTRRFLDVSEVDENYLFSAQVIEKPKLAFSTQTVNQETEEQNSSSSSQPSPLAMTPQANVDPTTPQFLGYITACLPPIHSPLHLPAIRALLFIAKRTNRQILLQRQQPAEFLEFASMSNNPTGPKNGLYSSQDWSFFDQVSEQLDSSSVVNVKNLLKTIIKDKKSPDYAIKKNFVKQYKQFYNNQLKQTSTTFYPLLTSSISWSQTYMKEKETQRVRDAYYKHQQETKKIKNNPNGSKTYFTEEETNVDKKFVSFDELYDLNYITIFNQQNSPSNTPKPEMLDTPAYNLFDGQCVNVRVHICFQKHPISNAQKNGVVFDTCKNAPHVDSNSWCSNCAFHVQGDVQKYTYLRQQKRIDEAKQASNNNNKNEGFLEKFMDGQYVYIKRDADINVDAIIDSEGKTQGKTYIDSWYNVKPKEVYNKMQYEPLEIQITSIKDFEHFIYRDGLNPEYSNTTLKTIHLNTLTLSTYGLFLEEQQRIRPNLELYAVTNFHPPFAISVRAEALSIQQSLVSIALAKQQKEDAANGITNASKLENRDKSHMTHDHDHGISPERPRAFPTTNNNGNHFKILAEGDESKTTTTTTPEEKTETQKTTTPPQTDSNTPPQLKQKTYDSTVNDNDDDDEGKLFEEFKKWRQKQREENGKKNGDKAGNNADGGDDDDDDAWEDDMWDIDGPQEDLSDFDVWNDDGTVTHWTYNKDNEQWEEDTEDMFHRDLPNNNNNNDNKNNNNNNGDGKTTDGKTDESAGENLPDHPDTDWDDFEDIWDDENDVDTAIPPRDPEDEPTLPEKNEDDQGTGTYIPPPPNKKADPTKKNPVGSVCGLVYNISTKHQHKKWMKYGLSPENPMFQIATWIVQNHCSVIYVHSHAKNPRNDNKYNRSSFVNSINKLVLDMIIQQRVKNDLPALNYKDKKVVRSILPQLDFMWGCNQFSQCSKNKATEFAVSAEVISALPYVLINGENNMSIAVSLQQQKNMDESKNLLQQYILDSKRRLTYDTFTHHMLARRRLRQTPGLVKDVTEIVMDWKNTVIQK